MTQEERYEQMLHMPIPPLIVRLAIPTIISMLITSIYNMADTFFVSQISTSASGAVGIISSVMHMIQAVGFTLGMGSGNYISRSLGNNAKGEAEKAGSTAFFTAIIIGFLALFFGMCFKEPFVYLLGATSTIAPYAMEYMQYILFAAPFMMGAFVMNNMLRSQGIAFYAMFGIATGGVLNIILDPILIFGFDMGIAGAAIATMISQMVSFSILLFQCNMRKEAISVKLRHFKPSLRLYGIILHAGLPSFGRQGFMSVASVMMNRAAGPYGDAAIAAMSIVSRCMMFINSGLTGFGQGFQPVCGFNYGAKRYDRVMEAFWFCLKVAVVTLTSMGVVFFFLAKPIITAFRREDAEVIAIGTLAFRLRLMTLPIQGYIIMSNMLTQSIGYGFRAFFIAIGRQGMFLIPMLLILPMYFGLLGVQLAQPVADVLTFLFGLIVVTGILKELKEKSKETVRIQG